MTHGFRVVFVLAIAVGLSTVGQASQGAAQSSESRAGANPCLLTFSRDALLTDGQGPLAVSRGRLRTFHDDCLAVRLVRGEASALVRSGARYITIRFESGRLDPGVFKGTAAPTGLTAGLSSLYREFFGAAPFGAGSRGGADEPARFLSRAFSGMLVVGREGLQLPTASGPLDGLAAFRVVTGNALRDPVEGVSFVAGVIRFAPGALQAGRSYAWEASMTTPAGPTVLSGAFEVAGATEGVEMEAALQARLVGVDPTDPRFLLESAAVYEERGHVGNAAILTARWFAGTQ